MIDHSTPISPLPGLGQCVRERGNFWDEAREKCTSEYLDAADPIDAGGPCVISFYEDYD
jgi:hypothetical protein